MTISRVIRGRLFTGRLKDEYYLIHNTKQYAIRKDRNTVLINTSSNEAVIPLLFFLPLTNTVAGGGNVTGHSNFLLHGYFFR